MAVEEISAERVYEETGCVYVIRDVWDGKRLVRCEFKTKGSNGEEHWRPCREGVSFSEIEPYEYRMPTKAWVV